MFLRAQFLGRLRSHLKGSPSLGESQGHAAWYRTAYPAHNGPAPPATYHQIPGTATALAIVGATVFHIIVVARPRAEAKGRLRIDGSTLIGAVQR